MLPIIDACLSPGFLPAFNANALLWQQTYTDGLPSFPLFSQNNFIEQVIREQVPAEMEPVFQQWLNWLKGGRQVVSYHSKRILHI